RKDKVGGYRIPHAPEILRRIKASIDDMLACLPDDERRLFADRLKRLTLPLPDAAQGIVAGEQIDAMTSGARGAGDSFHLVVMDAHRAINRLQVATAPEI